MNTKIILAVLTIIFSIISFGIISITHFNELSTLTQKLHDHSFKVILSTKNIQLYTESMHKDIQKILSADDNYTKKAAIYKINEIEKKVLIEYEILFQNYIASRKDVEISYDTFVSWKPLRDEYINAIDKKDIQKARKIANEQNIYMRDLSTKTNILVTNAQNQAKKFLEDSQLNKDESILLIYIFLFIMIVCIVIMAIMLIRFISKNKLDLEKVKIQTKDDLWIQEGISLLNKELLGKNSIVAIGLKSINTLCNYMNAGVGSFYSFDSEQQSLNYVAGFACVRGEGSQDSYKLGEGIVGQVALQKKPIKLQNIQETQLIIETGTSKEKTLNTYTFPILYEDTLLGVIEIGSSILFTTPIFKFLEFTNNIIATGLVTAKQSLDLLDLLKEAEQSNMNMEQRQLALDAHSIVGITDIHGTITYANSKFTEVSGYSNNELMGANHRIVNSGTYDDDFWDEMYKTISSGRVWHNAAIKNKRKDGSIYWVDTTIFPFMGLDGKPESYIAIRTDVTENKKAEEELLLAKEGAEQAVEAKANFLASMSHEIRTPMNGVIGMLDLLSREQLTKQQANNLGIANASAKSLLSVINDILDYSKIEAGKVELEYIEVDLKKEIGDFAKSIAITVKNHDVELLLDLTGLDHSYIYADIGRLKQILNNLVGNAIKFTHHGNIIIKATIDVTAKDIGYLIISVEDSGIGIPSEKIATLFDAFTQADNSTTRKYGGTGLGLSIAKNLVEMMGGELIVKSKQDKGSIFTFYFEVELSHNEPVTIPSIDIRGKKLLIVDDNEVNIQILRKQLELWDLEVTVAMSAKEAIDLCYQRDIEDFFDIAILDMQMPYMNGEALGAELSLMPKCLNMQMIMMTSYGRHENIEDLYSKGFKAFFMKPTTSSDLYEALVVLIGNGEEHSRNNTILTKDKINSFFPRELASMQNLKILLVEDNITNQVVAQGMLSALNLEADIANNGQEAVDILSNSNETYNLIFMDCQMPILDGFETTAFIREGKCGELYKNVPIIAMTANAMQGDKEKCLLAGMSDYISKPIALEVLRDALIKWIEPSSEKVVTQEFELDERINIKSWDTQGLLSRLGSSEKLLKKIMEVFLVDIATQMNSLKCALDDANIKEIQLHAHTIKGSAANLSTLKLQELAKAIENHVSTKSIEDLRNEYHFLEEEADNVVRIFNEYLMNPDARIQSAKKISKPELIAFLDKIKKDLEEGIFVNSSACDTFQADYNESINAKLKKLQNYIDTYSNDELFVIIEAIFMELKEVDAKE